VKAESPSPLTSSMTPSTRPRKASGAASTERVRKDEAASKRGEKSGVVRTSSTRRG
jgi:hypothetical protein